MNLVLVDKNARVGGLVCLEYHATHPVARAVCAGLAAAKGLWDNGLLGKPAIKAVVQEEATAYIRRELKDPARSVVLLSGNYVKQSKGVVSYHGTNPLKGSFIPGGRKSWNPTTGVFRMWAVIK